MTKRNPSWNVYRIDRMTGNFGEIVNAFGLSINDSANMNEAITYAKGEKSLNSFHYAVSNGLCVVFDTRNI